jgi:hypothetical protein
VGGRISPQRYPEPPKSYLLINDGKGKFLDATNQYSNALRRPGLVTSALWTDINNDNWTDLILVGEWMPITYFINNQGKNFTKSEVANTEGWWNSITGADFDNDGDMDYVVGNQGLNSIYKASEKEPVVVCAKDFDGNGTYDPILCRYIQGKDYPVHPRETLTGQMPPLRNVLTRYSVYGKLTLPEIIPEEKLKDALVYKATLMASVILQNNGKEGFGVKALPVEAQFAPIYGAVADDINRDGNLDIISIGNSYSTETLTGLMDAGIGNYLLGDGKGNFKAVTTVESGFFVDGDGKSLAILNLKNREKIFLATQNRGDLKVFKENQNGNPSDEIIKLKSSDDYAIVELNNGKKRKQEFYWGNGYLSSSGRFLVKDNSVKSVSFFKR